MNKLNQIKRLYTLIDLQVFTIYQTLNYARISDAITLLCELVEAYEGDGFEDFDLWSIGQYGSASLYDFIVGAYWHYTALENAKMITSEGDSALCALSSIYWPNMCQGPEPVSPEEHTFDALNEIAEVSLVTILVSDK